MSPSPRATYALIVGVHTYDNFPNQPVIGALNDVRRWFRFFAGHLGVKPENIFVLTSPTLSEQQASSLCPGVPTGNFGCATHDAVRDGVKALGDAVHAVDGSNGIFVWSGHGTSLMPGGTQGQEGATIALCPADTTNPDDAPMGNLLTFLQIQRWWSEAAAGKDGKVEATRNLTMILDTCYQAGAGARALVPNMPTVEIASDDLAVFERVMMAARQSETAVDVRVQQRHYGAFSFALTTMLEQWTVRHDGGMRFVNGSYADVMYRTRELISVLGIDNQTPTLSGFRGVGQVAVFNPDSTVYIGDTSVDPDVAHHHRQLSGDENGFTAYEFVQNNGEEDITLAIAIVVGVVPDNTQEYYGIYTSVSEYWYWDNAGDPADPNTDVTLKIKVETWPAQGQTSPIVQKAMSLGGGPETQPETVRWTEDSDPSGTVWEGEDNNGNPFALIFDIGDELDGPTWYWQTDDVNGEPVSPNGTLFDSVDTSDYALDSTSISNTSGKTWFTWTAS